MMPWGAELLGHYPPRQTLPVQGFWRAFSLSRLPAELVAAVPFSADLGCD